MISCTDGMSNKEISVLNKIKEERGNLTTITRSKANCIGHTLRRNCLLKRVIEGKVEVAGR
jgi:hypothetical protein